MEKETSPGTENLTGNETHPKRGRPRKHKDAAARARVWREKKKHEGRRLDFFVTPSVSWRIAKLSKAWGLPLSATVERLLMEACEGYPSILFADPTPDTMGKDMVPETK